MRRALLLFALALALPPSGRAQDAVPEQGLWQLDASHRVTTTGRGNYYGPHLDAVEVALTVSECGDRIRLDAPEGQIEALWQGGSYVGSTALQGGRVTVDLVAAAPETLTGTWDFDHPQFTMDWDVVLNLVAPDVGPSQGAGRVDLLGTEETREGLWVVERADWAAGVWDFYVNEASLLPGHTRVLDEAIGRFNPEAPERMTVTACEQAQRVTHFSPVQGYASQTGPEANNRSLARRRAAAVARYLGEYSGDFFSEDGIGGSFFLGQPRAEGSSDRPLDLPGVEAQCNRAASFRWTTERRFVEPYTLAEAQEWLEGDLQAACGGAPDPLVGPSARLFAKARYVLAVNFLDMIEAGHCTPPRGTPAHRLLYGEFGSAEGAVEGAFDLANDPSRNPYVTGFDFEGAEARHLERRRNDPYYGYTYRPRDEAGSAGAVADAAELAACGSVTEWAPWEE